MSLFRGSGGGGGVGGVGGSPQHPYSEGWGLGESLVSLSRGLGVGRVPGVIIPRVGGWESPWCHYSEGWGESLVSLFRGLGVGGSPWCHYSEGWGLGGVLSVLIPRVLIPRIGMGGGGGGGGGVLIPRVGGSPWCHYPKSWGLWESLASSRGFGVGGSN